MHSEPALTWDRVRQILLAQWRRTHAPGAEGRLYENFINVFVPVFSRASINLQDVLTAVEEIYSR